MIGTPGNAQVEKQWPIPRRLKSCRTRMGHTVSLSFPIGAILSPSQQRTIHPDCG